MTYSIQCTRMRASIQRINDAALLPLDMPPPAGRPRLGRSKSDSALSSRKVSPEVSGNTPPRALIPASASTVPFRQGEPPQRSASSASLDSVEKFENLRDGFAGLSPMSLKLQASILLRTMRDLAKPDGAANLAERLRQRFDMHEANQEQAVWYANYLFSRFVDELQERSLKESLETFGKFNEVSENYSRSVMDDPGDVLGFSLRLETAGLSARIALYHALRSYAAEAEKTGRSIESVLEEAFRKTGKIPSAEDVGIYSEMVRDEISRLPC